ncbi:MAG: hypothetical protein ABMA01_11290 [Chthoniobacteraceae bacterium]
MNDMGPMSKCACAVITVKHIAFVARRGARLDRGRRSQTERHEQFCLDGFQDATHTLTSGHRGRDGRRYQRLRSN